MKQPSFLNSALYGIAYKRRASDENVKMSHYRLFLLIKFLFILYNWYLENRLKKLWIGLDFDSRRSMTGLTVSDTLTSPV